MQRLYPLYKEAAKTIKESGKSFYTDIEISKMLDEKLESKEYQFSKLNLMSYLLDEYNINFIRSENEITGKGYKVASSEECVTITTKRLQKRIVNSARKQRKVLSIVDRTKLSDFTKEEYDAHLVRSGLFASFLAQTSLNNCIQGTSIRFDRPKIIE